MRETPCEWRIPHLLPNIEVVARQDRFSASILLGSPIDCRSDRAVTMMQTTAYLFVVIPIHGRKFDLTQDWHLSCCCRCHGWNWI